VPREGSRTGRFGGWRCARPATTTIARRTASRSLFMIASIVFPIYGV